MKHVEALKAMGAQYCAGPAKVVALLAAEEALRSRTVLVFAENVLQRAELAGLVVAEALLLPGRPAIVRSVGRILVGRGSVNTADPEREADWRGFAPDFVMEVR